jgi:uncharacterized protein YbjT (DUF2867 family)
MYVITGATGHTGKPLAMALLKAGKKVRVISRSADKAADLVKAGGELVLGDTANPQALDKAFNGATVVYAMIALDFATPDYYGHQKKHADILAAGLAKNHVPNVVSLSSVGTHLEKDSGVVFGLRYMEQVFNAIPGLNTLHLRPTYFMENVFGMIPVIKQMGIMGSPVKPTTPFSMIATQDIGAYAAKRMAALDFKGHNIQYLLGQRDLNYPKVAQVLGAAIGKPDLQYVEFPADQFKQAMLGMGASESLADNMNIFIKALNEGQVLADAKRTAESTTSTSIEQFAQTFAHVYNQ